MRLIILTIVALTFSAGYAQTVKEWDENLNRGKSVGYLSAFEKEVLFELNKARTDPVGYVEMYIRPMRAEMDGKLNTRSRVETKEGVAAIDECIEIMGKIIKMGPLDPDKDLARAAERHTSAQSKTKLIGHTSPNGETLQDRLKKFPLTKAGECISYGEPTARDVVTSLLIDDGVASRGHRKNILDPVFKIVGISAGGHLVYQNMCTIDFGGDPLKR
jgi:uncharacterized protein YkwD